VLRSGVPVRLSGGIAGCAGKWQPLTDDSFYDDSFYSEERLIISGAERWVQRNTTERNRVAQFAESKNESRMTLKVVLALVGLIFFVRQDRGTSMMFSIYVTLRVFLLLAIRNPHCMVKLCSCRRDGHSGNAGHGFS
jgi:hypothetical protein